MYPIKKANTATVIRKIFGDYIPKYGRPKGILSDHGTQFTSEKWIKALENEGIKPIFSSIRHSQSNVVERVHRELGRFFRTFVKERHTGWAKYLDVIQKIINETHHETTGFTPIELHLNTKPTRVWEKWIRFTTSKGGDARAENISSARALPPNVEESGAP